MKDLHKILTVKSLKPKIWNPNSRIMDEEPHTIKTLTPFTPDEKFLVFKRKIIAPLLRSQKNKNTLTSQKEDRWLVKTSNNDILGPYTKSEMKQFIDNNKFTDAYMKRDYDKDFVDFQILCSIPDFLESEKTDEFFKEINDKLENLQIEDKPSSMQNNTENNTFLVKERTRFCKCTEFLLLKKININIDLLIKKLYGKNRETAVNLVGFLTNLKIEDCEKLVNLIILESKNSVIADDNGFIKTHKKNSKKQYKY